MRGEKGKADLTKLLGHDYSETEDGPRLFEQLNFPLARLFLGSAGGSRSLDKFLRTIGV
jgi:hypothetical protein